LAKSEEELGVTDMADYALARLRDSSVKDIYILARRGPAQAKFTNPEIKELGELDVADLVISPDELVLDPISEEAAANDAGIQRNMTTMRGQAEQATGGKARRIHLRFLVSPVEIVTNEDGRITGVRVERNKLEADDTGYLNSVGTGEYETIPACMVLRSVGYRGLPLPDVPYDKRRGVIPNRAGRVYDPETDKTVPGEYVVGWAKRGPSGVIGTNKPDALDTVAAMVSDVPTLKPAESPDPKEINDLLDERGVRYVSFEEWRKLDKLELTKGTSQGRPRVKFTNVEEMLDALGAPHKVPTTH
jgi:ferredoxin--NADP+ reductase